MIFSKKKLKEFLPEKEIKDINDLKEIFNTGDYSFQIERKKDEVSVNMSRELKIGDFIEIIVNMIMAAPEYSRADLMTVVSYAVQMLQKKEDRILN